MSQPLDQIKVIADNDYPTFTVEVAAVVTKLQLINQGINHPPR